MAFSGSPTNEGYGGLTPRSVMMMGDNAGTPTPITVNSSGQQSVGVANASALTSGQFSAGVATGSTIAIAADPTARTIHIKNTHATLGVYIGPTGITTSNGHLIAPGEVFAIGGPGAGLAYYAITASSTVTCTWLRTK